MSYRISIPKPCNESWEKMEPTNNGRYCSVCNKAIYDFTNLSNSELVERIEKDRNLCARYKMCQLNTDLYSKKKRRTLEIAVAITITSTSLFSNSSSAQSARTNLIEHQEGKTNEGKQIISKVEQNGLTSEAVQVSGIIKDKQGPIIGATVILKGTSIGCVSNNKGEFSLTLQNKLPIVLYIRYIGYKQKELIIDKPTTKLDILLNEDDQVLMGEVVVVKHKQNVFKKIINHLKRK